MLKHSSVLLVLSLFFVHQLHSQSCTGGFAWDTSGLVLAVDIENQATGAYTEIGYNYGDGEFAYESGDHTYTYQQNGVYELCQFIADPDGDCYDYVCDLVYIGGVTCSAAFDWTEGGLDYNFSSGSLGDFDSLSWDFGDSTFSSDDDPQHIYDSSGTYVVCLSLYDGPVLCDVFCDTITVQEKACEALFDVDAQGYTVFFQNESRGDFETTDWSFGDGIGVSDEDSPTYDFGQIGNYEVQLRVANSDESCVDVLRQRVRIEETCFSQFFFEQVQGLTYTFEPVTRNDFQSLEWEFSDGFVSTTTEPTRTFTAPGTYEVCLRKYFAGGALCSFTCKDVNVFPLGLDDKSTESEWAVFPNPSSGLFTVRWSRQSLVNRIQILDPSGRSVYEGRDLTNVTSVDLSPDLAPGIYRVVVQTERGPEAQPLIVH